MRRLLCARGRGCSPRSCNTRTYRRAPAIAPWSFSSTARKSVKHAGSASRGTPAHGRAHRLAAQRREIVDRVEDQRLLLVTACVRRDGPPFRNEHDAIDVALDGHHPVGEGPRDAVAIAVEGDGLVLVHSDRGIDHAGVERMLGQGRRRGDVLGQTGLDQERTEERLHGPLTLGRAALAEKQVQLVAIGHAGHGGGEAALHGLDGPLGVGLLVAPRACSNGGRRRSDWPERRITGGADVRP